VNGLQRANENHEDATLSLGANITVVCLVSQQHVSPLTANFKLRDQSDASYRPIVLFPKEKQQIYVSTVYIDIIMFRVCSQIKREVAVNRNVALIGNRVVMAT
jgi:hypothetical protein